MHGGIVEPGVFDAEAVAAAGVDPTEQFRRASVVQERPPTDAAPERLDDQAAADQHILETVAVDVRDEHLVGVYQQAFRAEAAVGGGLVVQPTRRLAPGGIRRGVHDPLPDRQGILATLVQLRRRGCQTAAQRNPGVQFLEAVAGKAEQTESAGSAGIEDFLAAVSIVVDGLGRVVLERGAKPVLWQQLGSRQRSPQALEQTRRQGAAGIQQQIDLAGGVGYQVVHLPIAIDIGGQRPRQLDAKVDHRRRRHAAATAPDTCRQLAGLAAGQAHAAAGITAPVGEPAIVDGLEAAEQGTTSEGGDGSGTIEVSHPTAIDGQEQVKRAVLVQISHQRRVGGEAGGTAGQGIDDAVGAGRRGGPGIAQGNHAIGRIQHPLHVGIRGIRILPHAQEEDLVLAVAVEIHPRQGKQRRIIGVVQ